VRQLGPRLFCTLANKGIGNPVFLIPSAGVTPMSLLPLARSLPATRAVCSFAFAGMESDDDPHREIAEMAAAYIAEMREHHPEGPFSLGGYCFGGLVAFEMAAQLEAAQLPVKQLILIESFAPVMEDVTVIPQEGELWSALDAIFQRTAEQYRQLPPDSVVRLQKIFRLHLEAAGRYRASPIQADTHIIRTRFHPDSLYEDWSQLGATRPHVLIGGGTFSILRAPDVRNLARAVAHALEE